MRSTKANSSNVPLPVARLQEFWKSLADKYFFSRLPSISIEWSSRLTASTGMFVSRVGPRSRHMSWVDRHGQARKIRLSAPLLQGQTESEIVRTLAHEMIHQWQYDVKKCRPTHGPEFLKIMARMNGDGLGISIRHSLNQEVEAFTKYAWECTKCGESYRRQRRSISPNRHRCGSCHGSLREVSIGVMDQDRDLQRPIFMLEKSKVGEQRNPRGNSVPQQLSFDFV